LLSLPRRSVRSGTGLARCASPPAAQKQPSRSLYSPQRQGRTIRVVLSARSVFCQLKGKTKSIYTLRERGSTAALRGRWNGLARHSESSIYGCSFIRSEALLVASRSCGMQNSVNLEGFFLGAQVRAFLRKVQPPCVRKSNRTTSTALTCCSWTRHLITHRCGSVWRTLQ
jgi:hypothetical protein